MLTCIPADSIFHGPVNISELKNADMHTCRQYISWSCNNSIFGTVNFDSSPFTCSCKGGGGS